MNRKNLLSLIAAAGLLACAHGAANAQASPTCAAADGMVTINYFRTAGDYDNWGTHLWESFEKVDDGKITAAKTKSDQPLSGIAWTSPMKPSGKSDFGVCWQVKADEFRNTKVNFIVHKGDSKDCSKDTAFFTTQGKEVFVNQGDCTVFFSKDDAVKARK